jgi:hypothetical protein
MLNSYAQNRLIGADGDGEEASTPNSNSRGGGTEIGALMDVTALLGELVSRMGTAIEEAFAQQQNSNEALQRASISNDQQNQKKATASGAAGQPLVLPLDALFSVLSALDAAHLERHLPMFSTLKSFISIMSKKVSKNHGDGRRGRRSPSAFTCYFYFGTPSGNVGQ